MLIVKGLYSLKTIALLVALIVTLGADVCSEAESSTPSGNTDSEDSDQTVQKSTIGIAGVHSEVRKPEYRDKLIGFGIDAYIAEELSKAKLFRFLEEETTIVERIQAIQEKVWLLREQFRKADLVRLSKEVECDIIAYGRIIKMKERKERAFAGPVNILKKIGEVRIEVCLYFRETGEVLSATGRGKSSKGLWGFVTQGRAEALDFDDYMIGQASREAVREAVEKLVEQYRSRIKPSNDNTVKNEKEIEK